MFFRGARCDLCDAIHLVNGNILENEVITAEQSVPSAQNILMILASIVLSARIWLGRVEGRYV